MLEKNIFLEINCIIGAETKTNVYNLTQPILKNLNEIINTNAEKSFKTLFKTKAFKNRNRNF